MLILLPPSETKNRWETGPPTAWERLSFTGLHDARITVAEALVETSRRPDATAVLGVSPNLAEQVHANGDLMTLPAVPAADMYTGVLYDALGLASLSEDAQQRAATTAVIFSALYGALRLTDRVAPYRLGIDVTLPRVGRLSTFWRSHLRQSLDAAADSKLVVDCRSTSYVSAWRPPMRDRWIRVEIPGASHHAKFTRGLVARALLIAPPARAPEDLGELLAEDFDVSMQPPDKPSGPWRLAVRAVADVTPIAARRN